VEQVLHVPFVAVCRRVEFADENPDEDFVYHLKHCQLAPSVRFPIRSNAVMWLIDHRHIFKASWDTANPFEFRFPLFFTLGHLRKQDVKTFSWRKTSTSDLRPSLPGGWHFSYLTGRARNVHKELAVRRDKAWAWGSASVTHPKCLVQRYPEYEEFIDTVPWLVAQNIQQFAFFIPCQPAFYDTDDILATDCDNCSRLFCSNWFFLVCYGSGSGLCITFPSCATG
jgi:hypothetical protein